MSSNGGDDGGGTVGAVTDAVVDAVTDAVGDAVGDVNVDWDNGDKASRLGVPGAIALSSSGTSLGTSGTEVHVGSDNASQC